MYPTDDRFTDNAQQGTPDDCFGENTRKWLLPLGAVLAAAMIFSVVTLTTTAADRIGKAKTGAPVGGRAMSVRADALGMDISALPDGRGVSVYWAYAGPARKAGLQAGDIILRFNNRKVRNLDQFRSLLSQASLHSDVTLQIIRKDKRMNFTIPGQTIPNLR